MKKPFILIPATLIFLLCACGQAKGRDAQPGETPAAASVTESASTPAASDAISLSDLVYVELSADTQPDRGLVYQRRSGEEKALYLDVSALPNVLTIPAVYGIVGETITITPGFYGQVEMCAVDLRITYDSSQLRFLSCSTEDDALILNGEERGVIYANYLLVNNVTEGFDLCELTFQVLTAEACDAVVKTEVIEMVGFEGTEIVNCEFTAIPGLIHLNENIG